MTIVAHSHPFVVGVDTHARNHVYAIISTPAGELPETRDFPTTGAGINRAIAWVARRTGADLGTLWVIEGAAPTAPCWPVLSAVPDTRSPKPHGRTPGPVTGSGSPIRWTRTGSLLPSCPCRSSNCAGHG